MGKDATLQVRMDADIKERAELLYKQLGTSLAESVRMFAAQSLEDNAMPFTLHLSKRSSGQRIGVAAGKIQIPDDPDFCNDEISELFDL